MLIIKPSHPLLMTFYFILKEPLAQQSRISICVVGLMLFFMSYAHDDSSVRDKRGLLADGFPLHKPLAKPPCQRLSGYGGFYKVL